MSSARAAHDGAELALEIPRASSHPLTLVHWDRRAARFRPPHTSSLTVARDHCKLQERLREASRLTAESLQGHSTI